MSQISKHINIVIAERNYCIKTTEQEEMIVWKACEQIKVKLEELKLAYRAKDRQDYLAMTALTLAVDALKSRQDLSTLNNLEIQLDQTNEMLDKYLETIQ